MRVSDVFGLSQNQKNVENKADICYSSINQTSVLTSRYHIYPTYFKHQPRNEMHINIFLLLVYIYANHRKTLEIKYLYVIECYEYYFRTSYNFWYLEIRHSTNIFLSKDIVKYHFIISENGVIVISNLNGFMVVSFEFMNEL